MDPRFLNAIKYERVLEYTDSLNPENYIGDFEFGKIFRGVKYAGAARFTQLIIKIWDTSSPVIIRYNHQRLMREVIMLRDEKLKCHPAAVDLLGFVCDGEHPAVIFRLKALTTVLNQLNQADFSWVRRIRVALWVARMVRFFHNKKPPYGPVVLHNIDAAHILLDEDYVPKLFDFGLMTGGVFSLDGNQNETKTPCEHKGIHFISNGCGKQDDVFDFGLLLLSLISKRFISKNEAMESLIQLNSKSKPSCSLVHATLECEPHFYATDGEEVLRLALQCMSSSPGERLSMKQVFRKLQKLQLVQSHGDLMDAKPKGRP